MRKLAVHGALVAVTAVAVVFGAPGTPAVATDLNELRARAQAAADEVTSLEHRLESLDVRRSALDESLVDVGRALALSELELQESRIAFEKTQDRFVARAIEAYKGGHVDRFAMLLAAEDIGDLVLVEEITEAASAEEVRTLEDLLEAREDTTIYQERVDERKQRLLATRRTVAALEWDVASALADRRRTLRELTRRIHDLELQARRAAARSAVPSQALIDLLSPAGPSGTIPKGFAGTGVTFEGIASWYGPGFEGNPTASGQIFDPSLYTAASKELPLGTWLYVEHEGRGVVVLVNDRGPYVEGRILDLSQAAAEAIGIGGLGWIQAEILVET